MKRRRLRKNDLPLLPGAVCEQWVRCNKAACTRCPHGPYYRRFWRSGGKLRSAYVRRRDLDRVRQACEAWRKREQEVKETQRQIEELYLYEFREMREQIRELYREYGWRG